MTPREDEIYWEGFRQGFTIALVGSAVIGLASALLWWAVLS